MVRRVALTIVPVLIFAIVFNMNFNTIVMADTSGDGKIIWDCNIGDNEGDIPTDITIVFRFNDKIKIDDRYRITLYSGTFKKVDITVKIVGGNKLHISPAKRLKSSTRYLLELEKDSITVGDNPIEEISISFRTEKGFNDEDEGDSEETSAEEGERHGEIFGALLGEIHGRRDFHNGRTNSWTRWLPSDRDIIREYSLSKDDSEYSKPFIKAFKEAYKESYIKFFREANVEGNRIIKEDGMKHGQMVGELEGETQGKHDYIAGKDNDWRSNLPTDRVLTEIYNLTREHAEYMESFLVGYKEGYREAYVQAFQGENMWTAVGNLYTTHISMHGGEANSFDGEVCLHVEPGCIYEETALTIAKLNAPKLLMGVHITQATASYNIKIQNVSNFMDLKKPIVLEFQYYGPKTAGIYELKDGQWLYLHSVVGDDTISTVIDTNRYVGGTYVVLIDEKYESMDDIAGHWAAKPIEIFLRRNYINGYPDRTFRPDQSITRAEFVKILDNVHNWKRRVPFIYTNTYFADSSIFGVFANSISRAASLGYVEGYGDNTFRPHIPISYQEVEWLMQRITGKSGFKWDTVAEKILKDYYVRSKSYNSKQNYITRGEVVYLLYLFEEGLI